MQTLLEPPETRVTASPASSVRTRWVGGVPAWHDPKVRDLPKTSNDALLSLMLESLDRGHCKVAAQRFLKLEASKALIPLQARRRCEEIVRKMPNSLVVRMRADAEAWLEFVTPRKT
jgi:hypothetical protein